MVAQLAQSPSQTNSTQPSAVQGELQKLRDYCLRLNQALEAERAKSSKLRQYIARLNTTRSQPEPALSQTPDPALQSLVEDQTRLLERLYSENQQQLAENQKQRSVMSDLEHKIQQLLIANDKLKARNIELRRKLKPGQEIAAQTPAMSMVKPLGQVTTTADITAGSAANAVAEDDSSGKTRRWFHFSLTKK